MNSKVSLLPAMTYSKIPIDTDPSLSELIDRAASSEIITFTANGQEKAVLLSIEAFEHLISTQAYQQRHLMPLEDFRAQFKQALIDAGYTTREDVLELVQDVKREIVMERSQTHQSNPCP
jgi:prevent-host-death family protein